MRMQNFLRLRPIKEQKQMQYILNDTIFFFNYRYYQTNRNKLHLITLTANTIL